MSQQKYTSLALLPPAARGRVSTIMTVFSSGSEYRCWVLKDESYLGFGPLKYRDLPSFRSRAPIKEVDRSITSVALNIWALCNSPSNSSPMRKASLP